MNERRVAAKSSFPLDASVTLRTSCFSLSLAEAVEAKAPEPFFHRFASVPRSC